MKKIGIYCFLVYLIQSSSLVEAQTISQCISSLVEPRRQELYLIGRLDSNTTSPNGLRNLVLTGVCNQLGFSIGEVQAIDGRVLYFNIHGRSREGVIIHQFDSKSQLGIFSRLTNQSERPVGHLLNIFKLKGSFIYQLSIVDGVYHESISWGSLQIAGDTHAN